MKITNLTNNVFLLKELGKRIKDTRIAMNMTQKDLAGQAGVSLKTISRIENGENVQIEALLNILRTFKCLENMDLLITEQELNAAQVVAGKKMKKRYRKSAKSENNLWEWGE